MNLRLNTSVLGTRGCIVQESKGIIYAPSAVSNQQISPSTGILPNGFPLAFLMHGQHVMEALIGQLLGMPLVVLILSCSILYTIDEGLR